jgi:superfamily II DNA helicase RecQ
LPPLATPEALQTDHWKTTLFRDKKVRQRIIAVVVDEAHLYQSWGLTIRAAYLELQKLQTWLPESVSITAVSV